MKSSFFPLFKSVLLICMAVFFSGAYANEAVNRHKTDEERLDSLTANLEWLESRVMSTLMFGGSNPVSFNGDARLKLQYHHFSVYPEFMGHKNAESHNGDISYLQSGWDEAMIRLGLIVNPGRNTVLWAKLGFSHTFAGNRQFFSGDSSYTSYDDYRHEYHGWEGNIFEDMCAGIAIRTIPASFWIKMGNIAWLEASPFTIWKDQPRMFAWEYLPYEIEQPIARYYEYNIAKGEKAGRAAWHKKAFQGINIETITLPADFNFNFFYGGVGGFDVFERTSFDFATDLGYAADQDGSIVETGINDPYRHVIHSRLSKKMKNLILGLNFNTIQATDDIIFAHNGEEYQFNAMFGLEYNVNLFSEWIDNTQYKDTVITANQATEWAFLVDVDGNTDTLTSEELTNGITIIDSIPLDCGKGFYKESKVFSIDLRGKLGRLLDIHADIGISQVDTQWVVADIRELTISGDKQTLTKTIVPKKRYKTSSDFIPAIYAQLKIEEKIGIEADLIYAQRGFYAPFSFVSPMDAFWAFGSNLLGAGKFIGGNEASPYPQNVTGALLTFNPKLSGYGHLKIKYGQHAQLESARDMLYMPYRLNGMDINSMLIASYARWGVGTYHGVAISGTDFRYRLGDESFIPGHMDEGPEKGGLRSDYLSLFEGFVPYENSKQALLNYISGTKNIFPATILGTSYKNSQIVVATSNNNSVGSEREIAIIDTASDDTTYLSCDNAFVPHHKKQTFNLELDASYDVGSLIGYKNDLFLAAFFAVNGVSTEFKPLAFSDKDDEMLLWSLYFRAEPAIAFSNKFYMLALFGYENWRSQKAYINIGSLTNPIIKNVPINYKDYAFGIGFDWDVLDRVGLHGRFKYLMHKDIGWEDIAKNDAVLKTETNNWTAPVVSLEIKTFF